MIDAPVPPGYVYGVDALDRTEGSMVYKITVECICCGACQPVCPAEVISEGTEMYVIDADLCTGCGVCVEACPVSAIREVR